MLMATLMMAMMATTAMADQTVQSVKVSRDRKVGTQAKVTMKQHKQQVDPRFSRTCRFDQAKVKACKQGRKCGHRGMQMHRQPRVVVIHV